MKFKDLDKSVKAAFYAMGVIFIGLIIATAITIYIANKDHEDVIDRNYYEKGLNYEKTLEDNRIMEKEGYSISGNLFTERLPFIRGKNIVELSFLKKDEPIDDGSLLLIRERGATKKFTESYQFTNLGNGKYKAEIDIPEIGQWVITVYGKHASRTFRKTIQIVVQK
ncbi:MAG: nitrogen fixation protein FixH [Leptospira sp.]|jgi:nitrogen fixation protein FixH|nr:nitrogen fixation protein FixH [Leptospira sp.]NCS93983.1 nitrogen fixation protein FixH [Leptospira sp.]